MARFTYPDYKNNCFSNIPSTILSLFGISSGRPILPKEIYDSMQVDGKPLKIILLLIDGLGFNAWQKYTQKLAGFSHINKFGNLYPITAVFPTTTAAAITTINSGLTPQEHGLFEWFVYFPEIGKIIATLPFCLPGEKEQDALIKQGYDSKILYRGATIFDRLKQSDIHSFAFFNKNYSSSCYSRLISRGSNIIPFNSQSDLVLKLTQAVKGMRTKSYFYVYWDRLDHAAHHFGPGSKEYLNELKYISILIDNLIKKIKQEKNTLLIITADHGEIDINPEKTIFLNGIKGIEKYFKMNQDGQPILPFGNPRDVFFHVQPDKLKEFVRLLNERLGDKAKIFLTDEVIKKGLFGTGNPGQEFLSRVGNLLVLPYENNTVWYQYPNVPYPNFLGHHGGLSEDEILIPLGLLNLSTNDHY
ncbi:MAG: alkaline phosphatase family protein [Candidatus Gottesmanbacteria bacterium]